MRRLLKQPLRNPADLERLTAFVVERRALFKERLRVVGVIAAIITAMGSLIVASSAQHSDRFILPAMLVLAATLVTPFAMRRWWSHPRLLAAQRRLLQDQRGAGPELAEPEALISDLEARIDKAETLLAHDRPRSQDP